MIELRNVTVRSGAFAIGDVSLRIERGSYAALMGKTGSGKTTLLEGICGLKPVVSGSVHLHGSDVTRWKPGERSIGFVPQEGALFATMTVREQLAFAPKLHGWTRPEIDARVAELAGWLRIGHLLDRRPPGLSGGEAQRVALGRALAIRPAILCLDEPLSALDEETREEMCELLRSVRALTGVTALHVTHSSAEAARMADVVFRIEGGKVLADT